MTAVVVALCVVAVAVVAGVCFERWLLHVSANKAADRAARIEEMKAAPVELAALRNEVLELKRRLDNQSMR